MIHRIKHVCLKALRICGRFLYILMAAAMLGLWNVVTEETRMLQDTRVHPGYEQVVNDDTGNDDQDLKILD